MKPICPMFKEPCLEQNCSAFYVKRVPNLITAEGQGTYQDGWEEYDYCGLFNRKLPNKIN